MGIVVYKTFPARKGLYTYAWRAFIKHVASSLILGAPPLPLTIGPPEKQKLDVLNKDFTVLRGLEALDIILKEMVWIRSRIFRAPKTKHIKQGHPNSGHVLKKRRRKHVKDGPYTKVSATLSMYRVGKQGPPASKAMPVQGPIECRSI